MLTTSGNFEKKTLKDLLLQYRFDILLEMRLSGVAEQGYTVLYGKSQLIKLRQNYPDMPYEEEGLQELLNSVQAEYDSI